MTDMHVAAASLDTLGLLYDTDKASSGHDYLGVYDFYLHPLRPLPVSLLELGWWNGGSMRMWRGYFNNPAANIFGVDIADKDPIPGVEFRRADQADAKTLSKISDEVGGWDVVVDDASHLSPHTIASFKALWPRVTPGGFYFVEDLQVSYRREWMGTDPTIPKHGGMPQESVMEFLKKITDSVHYGHAGAGPAEPAYRDVAHVAFYPGLCVVQKALL